MKRRLVIGVALALSGPVLPLETVAEEWKETLDTVNVQTKSTLGIVADPALGLAAANTRIDLLSSAVADTNKTVSEVAASVERLRGPASRVWVSPFWGEGQWDILGTSPAIVIILNTGNTPAQVGCTFFGLNGTQQLDRAKSMTIPPGAASFCTSLPTPLPGDYEASAGWMIVHGDRPILVDGSFQSQPDSMNELQRRPMQFFPVDCSSPSGVEFVCDFD